MDGLGNAEGAEGGERRDGEAKKKERDEAREERERVQHERERDKPDAARLTLRICCQQREEPPIAGHEAEMLARSKPATLLRVFLVCFVRCSTASLSSTFKLRSSSYASPSALSFFQIQPLFVDVGNSTRFYFNMKLGVSDSFPNFEQARIMFMGPSQTSSIITWISSTRSLAGSPNQFAASSWFEATDEGGPWVVDKLVLYDTSANGWL
eukprot:730692-Hanusia_phi.AAC.4